MQNRPESSVFLQGVSDAILPLVPPIIDTPTHNQFPETYKSPPAVSGRPTNLPLVFIYKRTTYHSDFTSGLSGPMRFVTTFVISSLAALFIPSIAAAQFPRPNIARNSKTSVARSLASRQFKYRRDIVDVCISIDGQLFAILTGILNPELYADLKICLCLKDLNIWLDSSAEAQILIGLLGRNTVSTLLTQVLTLYIGTPLNPYGKTCTLPTNARRICQVGEPCAFECEENYTRVGDTCVCEAPYMECNGVCGDFPNGCGTQVPVPRKRSTPISTLVQAKLTCKRNESVCGIAGREGTLDFECVDTRVALDSCGGCITPHPFHEPYRSTVTGTECGRLPGVVSSGCENSQCVISRCRDGQEPSVDKSSCVEKPSLVQQIIPNTGSSGPLRLGTYQRRDVLSTVASPSPDLRTQIQSVANLVVTLHEVAHSAPVPANTPAVDYIGLAQSTVDATLNLLNSNTVANVVVNINALANLSTDFKKQLAGCECVENLGLGILVVRLDALLYAILNLQRWCQENPVGIPVIPEASSPDTITTPIPNTSDLAIDLGFDGLLEILTHLTSQASLLADVDVIAQIDATVIGKISALGQLVLDLSNSATLPPPSEGSAPIPIPIIGTPELPADASLARAVVQATVNLVGTTTVPALLANINALVDVNAIVASTLTNCGCIEGMGLGSFVTILDTVGQAALDLKNSINLDVNVLGNIDLDLDALLAELTGKLDLVGGVAANLELQTKIDGLVQLIIALQGKTFAAPSLLPSIPSLPTPGLPNKSMLGGIVRAMTNVLGSLTVPELLANLEALVDVNVLLGNFLNGCHCVQALGLAEVQDGVNGVTQAAIALKEWCTSNTIIEQPSSGALVANAEVLIQALATVSDVASR
ncbi:hypothetical protein BDZ94DRAFT_1306630 [Collybia nuda]|uniref:Protein CPL1-like domain-containing protein n=1 Tax=Collybia nuda TaxID=64659 RepID=A0A9P5YBU7_9AGAR|nr:hypothetical protein BDZ94DRAFT_1306630 [Collybia nuda]